MAKDFIGYQALTDAALRGVVRDALRLVRDLFRVRQWSGEGRYDLTADDLLEAAGAPGAEAAAGSVAGGGAVDGLH